ncbi:MAG TPA: hypothetical protein IGR64_09635 [Leptolyngbyaceae cyanobacterium M65_K2018_010]|nr:hypothetical protein [Leptolyngbyaceae cyanobacterium M65_K2018_010]
MARRIVMILLIGVLGWGIGATAMAQSDARLESRINRLESDLGRLRSQVSRIEYQLAFPNPPSAPPPAAPPPVLDEPSVAEQFDNLATLVIELKQQVRQLEARVTRLEARPMAR